MRACAAGGGMGGGVLNVYLVCGISIFSRRKNSNLLISSPRNPHAPRDVPTSPAHAAAAWHHVCAGPTDRALLLARVPRGPGGLGHRSLTNLTRVISPNPPYFLLGGFRVFTDEFLPKRIHFSQCTGTWISATVWSAICRASSSRAY